jgi:hypothetical protein
MPGIGSLRPFFERVSNTQTLSMSVTQSRSPRTQMPFGLLKVSLNARCSSTCPSGESLLMYPRPSFSAGLSSLPPNWLT